MQIFKLITEVIIARDACICINCFSPSPGGQLPLRLLVCMREYMLYADEAVQDELAEDVAEEAAALGEIDRLDVFSKHPEGVVVIKYKSPGAAADAISTFHNRWFGGRMIKCEYWDGKTEYRLAARAKAVHFACVIPRPLCSTFQFWCFTLVAVSTVQIEGVES